MVHVITLCFKWQLLFQTTIWVLGRWGAGVGVGDGSDRC